MFTSGLRMGRGLEGQGRLAQWGGASKEGSPGGAGSVRVS